MNTKKNNPWEEAGWLEDVQAWVRSQLTLIKIEELAAFEIYQERPWSIVLRVAVGGENYYFKASSHYLMQETRLTEYLARTCPDVSPKLVGWDLGRGWLLMRDAGLPIRTLIRNERNVDAWRAVLPSYVDLQKRLSVRVPELLQLGVMDRRLKLLPSLFIELTANRVGLLVDQPEGLTKEEHQYLLSQGGRFEQLCNRLEAFGIPESLHHDDFHDGNVFLKGGKLTFTDWGESAVTHPFFSLVVLLRSVENSLNIDPSATEIEIVRDWYLSGWSEYAPLAKLRQVAALAEQIGLVNRALTWHLVISNLPDNLKTKYASAVPSYLKDFIQSIEVNNNI